MAVLLDPRITVYQEISANLISHSIALIVTSPLEVVRTVQQLGTAQGGDFLATFHNIYTSEGLLGFYKGLSIRCFSLLPTLLARLLFRQWLREVLPPAPSQNSLLSYLANVLTLAEIGAVIVTYPLKTLNTRYVQQISTAPRLPGFFLAGYAQIIAEDGLMAPWRGLTSCCLGLLTGSLVSTVVERSIPLPESASAVHMFAVRVVATILSQITALPFSVVSTKERGQSSAAHGAIKCDITCNNTWDCVKQIYATQGVPGFFSGSIAIILKQLPYEWIRLVTYDFARKFFRYWNGYTRSPFSDTPKRGIPQNIPPEELNKNK